MPLGWWAFRERREGLKADVAGALACLMGDVAGAIVGQPFDRRRQPVDAAEAMLKGPDHQILDIVTLDSFRGGYVAHSLAITAVESKIDTNPLGVVAGHLEAVRARPQIGLIYRDPAVVTTLIKGPAIPAQEQSMSSHDAVDAPAVDWLQALLRRLLAMDRREPARTRRLACPP